MKKLLIAFLIITACLLIPQVRTVAGEEPAEDPIAGGSSSENVLPEDEYSDTVPSPDPSLNGIIKAQDGNWYNYLNGVVLKQETVAENKSGKWYINPHGRLDFKYNGFATDGETWYYIENGKVQSGKTGLIKGTACGETAWWRVVNGEIVFETVIASNSSGDWYVKNGKIVFSANTIACTSSGNYVVAGGKVDYSFNGFYSYAQSWWYVVNGRVQNSLTDVIKTSFDGDYAWWYIKGGKLMLTDTVASNANGYWAIINGKVDFTYEGFLENDYGWWYCRQGRLQKNLISVIKGDAYGQTAWWYIKSGKVTLEDALVSNANGTWYVKNGKIDFGANTIFKYDGSWWVIESGKVNYSFNGFAENANGFWYCENGKIIFSANGVYLGTAYGKYAYWTVSGGKVIEEYTKLYGKTTGTLYLRSGPGTSYQIVVVNGKSVVVPTGTTLDIKESQLSGSTTWYRVDYESDGTSYSGWVSGGHVTVITPDFYNEYSTINISATGTITGSGVNFRKGPGTAYASLKTLGKGAEIHIYGAQTLSDGAIWYRAVAGGTVGYVSKTYVKLGTSYNTSTDAAFEAQLDAQGFPESYKKLLRQIHVLYPNWKFEADLIQEPWTSTVQSQYVFGSMLPSSWGGTRAVSIIDKNRPAEWKSTDPEAYDSESGKWITNWDGNNWAIASKAAVRYYLDPRNFINETDIFQFLSLTYDNSQTKSVISAAAAQIGSSWLGENFTHTTDNTTIDYPSVLVSGCSSSNINPIALICIMTQELGTQSTALTRPQISGMVSGFTGYYNYFNIGAYVGTHNGTYYKTAYGRGLSVAKEKGWNSREKAVKDGAAYFAREFIGNNQQTVYYKRFNVVNGSNMHQFSTDIEGAQGEGKLLSKAYTQSLRSNTNLTFKIPVYKEMTGTPCRMP